MAIISVNAKKVRNLRKSKKLPHGKTGIGSNLKGSNNQTE
jgi:hypothetical protein